MKVSEMPRKIILGLVFSFFLCSVSQASECISNPNVEQGEGNTVTGWKSYCFQGRTDCGFSWDSTVSRSSSHSLSIRGGEGQWNTIFAVQPGKRYRAGFYVKTRSSIDYNPNAKLNAYLSAPELGTVLWSQGLHLKTSNEWIFFNMGDYIAQPGITSLTLSLKLTANVGDDSQVWFDDISVIETDQPVIPTTSYRLAADTDYVIWAESASKKVFLDDPPPASPGTNQEIQISAAGGESEAFQIVITPMTPWNNVAWDWQEFSGPQTLPKDTIKCYRVGYIDVTEPSIVYGRQGLHPDPLPIEKSSTLQATVNSPFWFLVEVPSQTPAGTYRSTVTLSKDSQTLLTFPVQLTVWNFSIPSKPSIQIDSHIMIQDVMNFEKGPYASALDRLEVSKRYYRDVTTHRSTSGPTAYLPVSINNGHATTNTTELEQHVAYLKTLGDCTALRIYSVLDVSGTKTDSHHWPQGSTWENIPIFLDSTNTSLNPAFVRPFSEHVSQAMNALKRQKCYGTPYIKFFDEPDITDLATVNAVKNIAILLKQIDQNIKPMASGLPHRDLVPLFGRWDFPGGPSLNYYVDELSMAMNNNTAWIYDNSIPLQDIPLLRTRLFHWQLWKAKLKGAYNWWSITSWEQNPWNPQPPNAGSLLYPPRNESETGPISSLRWEMMRQGLEDYEYLFLLAKLLDEKRNSAPQAVVAEAERALQRTTGVISEFSVGTNDQPYTLDPKVVDEVRADIARSIESLTASVMPPELKVLQIK